MDCTPNNVGVTFTWIPVAGAEVQWLDLSLTDNDFAAGTFLGAGPLDPSTDQFSWDGLIPGSQYFWRINALTPNGWVPSATDAFSTCNAPSPGSAPSDPQGAATLFVDLVEATRAEFPESVDSNSPAFWDNGTLMVFNSTSFGTYRSGGDSLEDLADPIAVQLPEPSRPGAVWLEAVWLDADSSVLYGWYHFEPADLDCLTAPIIGAAVSFDYGITWEDHGFIIENGYPIECDYENGFVAGGNGDFSVIVGPDQYFYFLFSNYVGPLVEQGIAIARSSFQDKGQPGTVAKFYQNGWTEPGIGGAATAIFPSSTGWKGPFVDAYWGPSVHWNTYLGSYMALLNHTEGEDYSQEGVYVTYSWDLVTWSRPEKLLDTTDWYPQVMGLGPGESDSIAGQRMRLYVSGMSDYILEFRRAGE